jgi:hypothetical protein
MSQFHLMTWQRYRLRRQLAETEDVCLASSISAVTKVWDRVIWEGSV